MTPVDLFLERLAEVTDPERKRRIIGHAFIEVFETEANAIGGARFLGQGTLYPDVIESVSFKGPSAMIKSHHNVGGLPERMRMELIEPLRELFKDEVREVGRQLGLGADVVDREPFPGPGLAVRIVGEVTRERLELLRRADAVVMDEVARAGLGQAYLAGLRRAAAAENRGRDGRWAQLRKRHRDSRSRIAGRHDCRLGAARPGFLARVSSRITNEVKGVNRVVYDITSKPPATIEWE